MVVELEHKLGVIDERYRDKVRELYDA